MNSASTGEGLFRRKQCVWLTAGKCSLLKGRSYSPVGGGAQGLGWLSSVRNGGGGVAVRHNNTESISAWVFRGGLGQR